MSMIEIDGSYGEGGGQILRTSLSLAAVTGKAVHFTKIRANRRKPGLMRQHRICALAAAEITGGKLTDAELNSQEMTFEPGSIRGGEYHFTTGSAGSTMLIAQTVVPILLHASEPSRVFLEGGTHTPGAPVFDFFDRVYLPCLRRMGGMSTAGLMSHWTGNTRGGVIRSAADRSSWKSSRLQAGNPSNWKIEVRWILDPSSLSAAESTPRSWKMRSALQQICSTNRNWHQKSGKLILRDREMSCSPK